MTRFFYLYDYLSLWSYTIFTIFFMGDKLDFIPIAINLIIVEAIQISYLILSKMKRET